MALGINEIKVAEPGLNVTLEIEDQISIVRGSVISSANAKLELSNINNKKFSLVDVQGYIEQHIL